MVYSREGGGCGMCAVGFVLVMLCVIMLIFTPFSSALYFGSSYNMSPGRPQLRMCIVQKGMLFLKRRLATTINNQIKGYEGFGVADEYRIFNNYSLARFTAGDMAQINHYSPPEILGALCEYVIGHNTSVMMFIQDEDTDDFYEAEQYLLQMAASLGIPVLAYTGLIQPSPSSLFLQLTPSIFHQCQAMFSLLTRYSWEEFSIITSSLPGRSFFTETLRDMAGEHKYNVLSSVHIPSVELPVISKVLAKVDSDTRVILLYASESQAQEIFKVAKNMKLLEEEYVWIVIKSVIATQVSGDRSPAPKEYPPGLLAINYGVPDEEIEFGMLEQSKQRALEAGVNIWVHGMEAIYRELEDEGPESNFSFFSGYQCLGNKMYNNETVSITQRWKHGARLYEAMKNVEYDGFQFKADGTRKDSELDIYNVDIDNNWKKIGMWETNEGLTINDVTWPKNRRTPPRGRPAKYHLKIVTIREEPYVIYSDPDATGREIKCPPQSVLCRVASENITGEPNVTSYPQLYQCCSGLSIDLLIRLSESMDFHFDLYQVEDNNWGAYNNDTKEWNGLIQEIISGKADMVMTSLTITPERNKMIDFSIPYLETGITIVVAVREGVISPTAFLALYTPGWLALMCVSYIVVAIVVFVFELTSPSGYNRQKLAMIKEPYDYPSWCLILVFSVHASGAAIFIFEWLSPSGLDRGNKPIRDHRFSLFRSFWLIWSMLFGAAVNVDNPRGVSSRFLGNIWALFAVVFTASYTANLAAFMITKEDYDRLTGIQDDRLKFPDLHKPPFKFGTLPHGSTDTNIKKNYPAMHAYMKQYNKSSVELGVKAIKEGDLNAFIYDATVLEYWASHDECCKLRTVGSWYAMTGYGVGFPKGSKWIPKVNRFLSQYQYEGLMERFQKFWLSGACKKGEEEGESSLPLGILNFTSAFILLAAGMLLGGLLLLLEHIYFKFFRAKLRKWDKCGCCGLVSLSMGKSLTFEQSVREAMDLQKHFRCKNPICETQVWKLKHELDLALLRIDRMQRKSEDAYDKRAVWKDPTRRKTSPAIGWQPDIYPKSTSFQEDRQPAPGEYQNRSIDPSTGNPPSSDWKDKHYTSCESPLYTSLYDTPGTSGTFLSSDGMVPEEDALLAYPERSPAKRTTNPIAKSASAGDLLNSRKSLSASPMKRPVAGPSSMMANTALTGSDPNGPIRSQDYTDKRAKFKKGRAVNADGSTIEIETVL